VRLTTSPPSRAECQEILEPKIPGTLWATPGLFRDSFTFFCNKSYENGKGVVEFAVNYGACGSDSGTATQRPSGMKLIKQINLALTIETGWLLLLRKQSWCLGYLLTEQWAGQSRNLVRFSVGAWKFPFPQSVQTGDLFDGFPGTLAPRVKRLGLSRSPISI
jgi:hypothetical protein